MASQAENRERPARPEIGPARLQGTQKLLAAGGVLGAVAASSCCLVPLLLFGLGVSGAWISQPDPACALSAVLHRRHGRLPCRRLLAALPLKQGRLRGWRRLRSTASAPGREY